MKRISDMVRYQCSTVSRSMLFFRSNNLLSDLFNPCAKCQTFRHLTPHSFRPIPTLAMAKYLSTWNCPKSLSLYTIIYIQKILPDSHLKWKVQFDDKRKRDRLQDALFVDNMLYLLLLVNLKATHDTIVRCKWSDESRLVYKDVQTRPSVRDAANPRLSIETYSQNQSYVSQLCFCAFGISRLRNGMACILNVVLIIMFRWSDTLILSLGYCMTLCRAAAIEYFWSRVLARVP